jgi:hypothetical protein
MNTIFSSLISAGLKQFFTKGIGKLWENKDSLMLYLKTLFGKYRKERIRFSISYLFRIRIPETNSYLLVLNRRINNQLQPVGGSYKRYGDDKLFESWEYMPDHNKKGLGTDTKSENDLRFTVKGKKVIEVIKWFEEGKEREVSGNREFAEELLNTNILDKTIFQNIEYKHLRRFSKHLHWSNFHNCFEVMIFDILEFLPSAPQKQFLISLKKQELNLDQGYAIVECEDIEQLRLMKDGKQIARIGEHTKLIINQNF